MRTIFGAGTQSRLRGIVRHIRPSRVRKGIDYNPFDRRALEVLAARLIADQPPFSILGTLARGRDLLKIIGESFPTEALVESYFENLEAILRERPLLEEPGRIVIGLGTGRCGSTSLAFALAGLQSSCGTHENPPLISWEPEAEQVAFHLRRFHILRRHFRIVADVSHWWLKAAPMVLEEFPNSGFIGLIRDEAACAESFMIVKERGPGTYNHWAPFGNGIWAATQWDPCYPTFALPTYAVKRPDKAKHNHILRYIREYNRELKDLGLRFPDRGLIMRTEDLNDWGRQLAIFAFAGGSGYSVIERLNARSVSDGRDPAFHY